MVLDMLSERHPGGECLGDLKYGLDIRRKTWPVGLDVGVINSGW